MSAVPSRFKRLYPLVFMLAVTFLFMSAVTGAHLATRETVERNKTLFLKRAVLLAAGLQPPADNAAAEAFYQERVRPLDEGVFEVAGPDGAAVRVVSADGAGLWGRIGARVGLRPDGALAGIAFTEQSETPGLGARINEPGFREQFKGKRPPLKLVPERTRSAAPDEVDAITGASVTSKAVRDLVNRVAAGAGEGGGHGGG